MTVLACKDGVIAADSGNWAGDGILIGRTNKLLRLECGEFKGSVVGLAGWRPAIDRALAWLRHGGDRPRQSEEVHDLDLLILKPDGEVWTFCRHFELYQCTGAAFAAGSHHTFLLGAMLAGASAEEAVALAVEHCAHAAGPVCSMRACP